MRKYNDKVIGITLWNRTRNHVTYWLSLHLSSCDTMSHPYGKGKKSAIKLMDKMDLQLKIFIEEAAEEHEWTKARMRFLSFLYCGEEVESLSDLRSRDKKSPTNLRVCSRVHKTCTTLVLLWRAADKIAPLEFTTNLSLFGWRLEEDTCPCIWLCWHCVQNSAAACRQWM